MTRRPPAERGLGKSDLQVRVGTAGRGDGGPRSNGLRQAPRGRRILPPGPDVVSAFEAAAAGSSTIPLDEAEIGPCASGWTKVVRPCQVTLLAGVAPPWLPGRANTGASADLEDTPETKEAQCGGAGVFRCSFHLLRSRAGVWGRGFTGGNADPGAHPVRPEEANLGRPGWTERVVWLNARQLPVHQRQPLLGVSVGCDHVVDVPRRVDARPLPLVRL